MAPWHRGDGLVIYRVAIGRVLTRRVALRRNLSDSLCDLDVFSLSQLSLCTSYVPYHSCHIIRVLLCWGVRRGILSAGRGVRSDRTILPCSNELLVFVRLSSFILVHPRSSSFILVRLACPFHWLLARAHTLQGQAGIQVGNACWELYCLEHGIPPDGTIALGQARSAARTMPSTPSSLRPAPASTCRAACSSILSRLSSTRCAPGPTASSSTRSS